MAIFLRVLILCIFSIARLQSSPGASLMYYIHEQTVRIDAQFGEAEWSEDRCIPFSSEELDNLWNEVNEPLAKACFDEAVSLENQGDLANARLCYRRASIILTPNWMDYDSDQISNYYEGQVEENHERIEENTNLDFVNTILKAEAQLYKSAIQNLNNNPYISSDARAKMSPFLLDPRSSISNAMDSIFRKSRATANEQSLRDAGFTTLFVQPRSFIRVVRHPQLPGYLLKIYLDNETRKKRGKEGWEWFVRRCEGAARIQKVITDYKIKYFAVPKKRIYPLPPEPSPPSGPGYTRHIAVLAVQDMDLVSKSKNREAWRTKITKKHLQELYKIISKAHGRSFRADNIPRTNSGKFAFIDTEYPPGNPDFGSIRPYLSTSMRAQWDNIVKSGGR